VRTYVYIDGFNLYFGALKGTAYRWLDVRRLCGLLLPHHQIECIKYFTAIVVARPKDPDQPLRQQTYLRALRTIPDLEIILGHYLTHAVMMPVANPRPGKSKYVRVLKSEEKGSDVNMAAHLVNDAHLQRYDAAVLVTNDSDLLEAVTIVKGLGKRVGVLNPHQHASRVLAREATFLKRIRSGALRESQFPLVLTDVRGEFRRPQAW
jgi:uncharacterized LabA/DUF88 family protein